MIYQWSADTYGGKLSPTVAGRRFESIKKKNNGKLTAKAVLEDARSKQSPLHIAFEWDDKVAAEKHRLHQAANMLVNIYVTYPEAKDIAPVRAYVSVKNPEDNKKSYAAMHDVLANPEYRKQLLHEALDEVKEWRRRYAAYQELASIFNAIDKAA